MMIGEIEARNALILSRVLMHQHWACLEMDACIHTCQIMQVLAAVTVTEGVSGVCLMISQSQTELNGWGG